jgi:hypothetical protein
VRDGRSEAGGVGQRQGGLPVGGARHAEHPGLRGELGEREIAAAGQRVPRGGDQIEVRAVIPACCR